MVAVTTSKRHAPITLICQECKQPFTVLYCFRKRKYCGRACSGIASGRHLKGRPTGKPAHNRVNPDRPLTQSERQQRHRKVKYAEWDALPKVPCACGCGQLISPINAKGLPGKYARGHNPTKKGGVAGWNRGKKCPDISARQRGKKKSPEEIAKRQATRLANNGGVYQVKNGWQHSPKTIERMKIANSAKAMRGPDNPFYGKKHSPELMAQIAAKNTGPLNANWAGGVSTLPYGPEFTRARKREILARDNHTCQRCGKAQAQLKRKLQVHHIDHNKENNSDDNLCAACGSCNVWLSYHRHEFFTPLNRR